jgi:outer membrane protein
MTGRLIHAAMALLTAASLVVSPVFAQAQSGQTQDASAQQQAQPSSQPQQPATTAPPPARSLNLNAGPNYSNGRPFFPNIFEPYRPLSIALPPLTNSPRITQLIHDGKLELSLDDAVSLALENNLDISVQRFTPWIAQVNLLRTKGGGASFGTGSSAPVLLGSAPSGGFDPILTSSATFLDETFPVTNPFLAGTGSSALSAYITHESIFNTGYAETFHTGTSFQLSWDNTRESSTAANIFNPFVQSQLAVSISQPLLRGFGFLPNTRYIVEAKNTLKVADAQFAQAVINDVTTVENYYWELVYARESVKVEQTTVATDEQLYENNKKQLEIGTMAPLDVLTAESQLASDQQALVAAQTTQLQDETQLLNAITKNPLDASLSGVEIIPTTELPTPDVVENIAIQQAVQEAWSKRPEMTQLDWNLKNSKIEVRATRNELLPSLGVFAQYSATGLGGNETVITSTTPTGFNPILTQPIVDPNGNPITGGNPLGPIYVGSPIYPTGFQTGGVGDALSTMIHGQFPSFIGGVSFSLPIRNRQAQADNAQAQLNERQLEVTYREEQNAIFVNVRNAIIALTQDRAQVAAAEKARLLAQQTLDAEQKKFQLGSSTAFTVTQRIQQETLAASQEVRARANLAEAYALFNQAMGRTLETNRITLADAKTGNIYSPPNIPGWLGSSTSQGQK